MEAQSILQIISESQLLSFYGWWQFGVCLFAFAALMVIWYHIGRKQKDFGQVWLALSVLCWGLSGLVEVYFSYPIQNESGAIYRQVNQILEDPNNISIVQQEKMNAVLNSLQIKIQNQNLQLDGWRSILSLFNSLFILLALPWFRYMPKQLEPIIKSKYWIIIIGLPFLFSLLPTISKMIMQQRLGMVSELDVYYAILTLIFLGTVLFESFDKRRLAFLAWLSVLCILITFLAQLYKLSGSNINLTLFSAIFKTSLIMIFFALALSWVKELAENIIPPSHQLFLTFVKQKNEKGRYDQKVIIKGFPGANERSINFTPTLYELFLTFAERRKNRQEDWLEIKPKNDTRPNIAYDIHDHNQIKRLLTTLLDGLFGKGAWSKAQHEQPLRSTLFEMSEKRERKIRLRIPAENITIN